MTAPPAKVKACLVEVKDQVVDSKAEWRTAYLSLIRMELLQRGVAIPSPLNETKMLESVRSTAGRSLLDKNTSALPIQLLTASAVMAGRVAEQCAANLGKKMDWDSKLLTQVLERCREVGERRLSILLNLCNNDEGEKDTRGRKISLLYIAEGFFLRAASFQPDTPPMWKRCWDVTLEIQKLENNSQEGIDFSPPQAAYPLSNMVRIVEGKGNKKRATELSLQLAESWLETIKTLQTANNDPIIEAYVAPYQPPSPSKKSSLVDLAQKVFRKSEFIEKLSPDDKLLYKMLAVKIKLAHEETEVEEMAQNLYKQAKNRANDAFSSKGSTENYLSKARRQFFAESEDETFDLSALHLRDAFLEFKSHEGELTNSFRLCVAANLIRSFLLRGKEQTHAVSLTKQTNNSDVHKQWARLGSYIEPILHYAEKSSNSHISSEKSARVDNMRRFIMTLPTAEKEMFETIAEVVPFMEWMCCGISPEKRIIAPDILVLTCDILNAFLGLALDAKQKRTASNFLKSSNDEITDKIHRLQCAHTSLLCLCSMSKSELDTDIGHSSEQAATMWEKGDQYSQYSIEFGCAFLQLLVVWSGLHQTPWPFVNIKEARMLVKAARDCLSRASTLWGRKISHIEQLLLDVANADAESGLLAGGFLEDALKLFIQTSNSIDSSDVSNNLQDALRKVLLSHCWAGLTRIVLQNDDDDLARAEDYSRRSLSEVEQIKLPDEAITAYLWTSSCWGTAAVQFHLNLSRQMVADTLVLIGKPQEALSFLEDAVRDSSLDSDAAFALGAFRLREVFSSNEVSAKESKAAQAQLLKAAKLNAKRANPFALLGLWYEEQKDMKRAIGCYSKALLLDPPNPVAGRGVLRLTSFGAARKIIDSAVNSNSPLNGWAWRALGNHKAMSEGENGLAVVALLKALRCRDIEKPENETLSFFFCRPSKGHFVVGKEKADAFAELASCYRRLGRYTAAIRAFNASMDTAGEATLPSVLCSCAEVELHLGLLDEAAEKFKLALGSGDISVKVIAAHGQGLALLAISRREFQSGKAGSAFGILKRAIEGCLTSESNFFCVRKLLGDLYSFGASFPPDVFQVNSTNSMDSTQILNDQIEFVCNGEKSYREAENVQVMPTSGQDEDILRASLITDIGANLLLQSQLMAFAKFQHLGTTSPLSQSIDQFPDVKESFERSANEFRRAIELCPLYAPAWCGLGCAVLRNDPLLAQHAFCRSIQLDNLSPDAYSNLSMLYTKHHAFSNSEQILDALTQVADTPMMWINRAMILERNAAMDIAEDKQVKAQAVIVKAVDAYRAALQVSRQPSAILGLAMTCRVSRKGPALNADTKIVDTHFDQMAKKESYDYIKEYIGTVSSADMSASLLDGVMKIENSTSFCKENSEIFLVEGRKAIKSCEERLQVLQDLEPTQDPSEILDLELIRRCLLSENKPVDECKTDIAAAKHSPEMSLSRKIIQQPARGDLWLKLAKGLSKGISSSKATLESARLAANRAVKILTHQLNHPSENNPWSVDARDLSDALSLVYWLENLNCDAQTENKPLCNIALQRSLMMYPNNSFARTALNLSKDKS